VQLSKKIFMPLLRCLFGLSLLGLVVSLVESQALYAVFSSVSLGYIALLILISVILIEISVVKWRLFLRFFGGEAKLLELFSLYLAGYFFSTFLPSQVGGDAVRSWSLGKRVGQRVALSSTILERYTGLLTMLFFGCIGLCFAPKVPFLALLFYFFICIAVAGGTIAILNQKILKILFFYTPFKKYEKKLLALREGLASVIKSPKTLFIGFVLSVFFNYMMVVNLWVACHAVGWTQVYFIDLCLVLPLISVVGNIPVSPSGLGVQEGAIYFFLQSIGATPSQSLGVALILRAKVMLLAVVGGVVYMFSKNQVISFD
jgi:glycosyltransferase 2 family protein